MVTSLLERLLGAARPADDSAETSAVRKIVDQLEALEPDQARFLAAFAFILSRVAYADRHIGRRETRAMERIVRDLGHLPDDETILVVQIAKSQNRLFGGTENFLVTREFKETTSEEQRLQLLDCLFAVSAADGAVSAQEEAQIRQIASELGLDHKQYVEARMAYSDQREVLRPFHEAESNGAMED
jgi:uncharacterized tellurite resistance protein B-like protein